LGIYRVERQGRGYLTVRMKRGEELFARFARGFDRAMGSEWRLQSASKERNAARDRQKGGTPVTRSSLNPLRVIRAKGRGFGRRVKIQDREQRERKMGTVKISYKNI